MKGFNVKGHLPVRTVSCVFIPSICASVALIVMVSWWSRTWFSTRVPHVSAIPVVAGVTTLQWGSRTGTGLPAVPITNRPKQTK